MRHALNVHTDRASRVTGILEGADGTTLKFCLFGDTRIAMDQITSDPEHVCLLGTLDFFNREPQIKSPVIVPAQWTGTMRPVYHGKRKAMPDVVRAYVTSRLKQTIPATAQWLRDNLCGVAGGIEKLRDIAGIPDSVSLERVLWLAHLPGSPEQGATAQRCIEYLAAYGAIVKAQKSARESVVAKTACTPGDWRSRARQLAFAPTQEQLHAISDIVQDLGSPTPMRRFLSGDVGTGKTAVFATAAAACVDGGARVAILLPNERLVDQVFRNITGWWPDIHCCKLTASSSDDPPVYAKVPLLIGTTAMMFRETGEFDFVIIDEQHKFSRAQRERLILPRTHLLEVSATCIPRSQALLRFGSTRLSRLFRGHVKKAVKTRIWTKKNQAALFAEIQESCSRGDQIIVVYPRKNAGKGKENDNDKKSAESTFRMWSRLYPGKVVLSHGGLDRDANRSAMEAMMNGTARILIATTVVEVGIDLPGVRRVVVIHPDTLGLTQLHQLRGRAARTGGKGWFDLYLPRPVSDATMERLQVMTCTTDGFEIAERDMRLRGFGDLSAKSNKQSGVDDTFLFGRTLTVDLFEEILEKRQHTGTHG